MWFLKRKSPLDELLGILQQTRSLLARPDADFAWSSWEDQPAALAEMDRVIRSFENDARPDLDHIRFLYVVTGPICEVAVSSGWGDEYAKLGDRVDAILEKLK